MKAPRIDRIDVTAYTIPTDAPESDGTSAWDQTTLVLVEVKARRGTSFGLPEEAVDARKQRKLRMLLETYRAQSHRRQQPCRIDVLGLLLDERLAVTRTEHIRDAVQDTA